MNSINQKIYKYQSKLQMTDNPHKKNQYNNKIKYYKSLMMKGGDTVLLDRLLAKQKMEAEKQLEEIRKSLEQNNINKQFQELVNASNNVVSNYNALGNDFRTVVNKYSSSMNDITKELSDIDIGTIDAKDIEKATNKLGKLPSSLDDVVKLSLARDLSQNKNIDDELEEFGLTLDDITPYLDIFKNNNGNNSGNNGNNSGNNNISNTNNNKNNNTNNSNKNNGVENNKNNAEKDEDKEEEDEGDLEKLEELFGQLNNPENNNQSGGNRYEQDYNSFFDRNQYNDKQKMDRNMARNIDTRNAHVRSNEARSSMYGENNFINMGNLYRNSYDRNFGGINNTTFN